jgi:hypothetical protein
MKVVLGLALCVLTGIIALSEHRSALLQHERDSVIVSLNGTLCYMKYAVEMQRIGDAYAGQEIEQNQFLDQWILNRIEFRTHCVRKET